MQYAQVVDVVARLLRVLVRSMTMYLKLCFAKRITYVQPTIHMVALPEIAHPVSNMLQCEQLTLVKWQSFK